MGVYVQERLFGSRLDDPSLGFLIHKVSLQRTIQEMREQDCPRITRQRRVWDTDIRTEFLERGSERVNNCLISWH